MIQIKTRSSLEYLINAYESQPEPSPDVYDLREEITLFCPTKRVEIRSYIVYINPNNNQAYLWCHVCARRETKSYNKWHRISDVRVLDWISHELGMELVKYRKQQTEDIIFKVVKANPGINFYRLAKASKLTKDKVRRGVARLKTKKRVRLRCVRNEKRVYPIIENR